MSKPEIQYKGEKAVPYPEVIASINSMEGFTELFFEKTKTHKTYEEAYESAEKMHEQLFQSRRYSSYSSFRRALRRKLNA